MSPRNINFDPNQIAIDAGALGKLKRAAGQDPQAALRATAQQFETLFMNMLMKSMRDTLPKEGLLSSSANDMYTGMLDQQFAQKMSSRGTGIADMIVKQLSKQMQGAHGAAPTPAGAEKTAVAERVAVKAGMIGANRAAAGFGDNGNQANIRFHDPAALVSRLQGPAGGNAAFSGAAPALTGATDAPRAFVRNMGIHAANAERLTGIPAKFMLGQAALESGWGKKQITHADGGTAHNLFGIKAGGGWTGKTVSVTTTEYVGGVARKLVEKFRAYSSYAESFRDYANLMVGNPRYQDVIKRGGSVDGFANAMQRAGYATDPRYAEKLSKTINHMISLKRMDSQGVSAGKEI